MNEVLETVICTKVPGVMMLSTFETLSGVKMYKIVFLDVKGFATTLSCCPTGTPDAELNMHLCLANESAKRI